MAGFQGPLHARHSLVARLTGDTFASFEIVDFRHLYIGNITSQLSIWMQQLVFSWLLLELGNSPFWLGLGGLLIGLTLAGTAPLSGVLADVVNRRWLMFFTQGLMLAVNAATLALLLLDWLQIWHLLLAMVCMGVAFSFNMPARQAWTIEIVGRRLLHNATALHGASLNVTRVVGPALAGTLMATFSSATVLALNLPANVWTLYQLTRISHRPSPPTTVGGLRGGALLEGFGYCWKHPVLRLVVVSLSLTSFVGGAYVQLLPALARNELGGGPDGLGVLTSALGGGAILGSLLIARRDPGKDKASSLLIIGSILGLLLVGLGLSRWLPLTAGLLAVAGLCNAVLFAVSTSAISELAPERLVGRAMGVLMMTLAIMPIGSFPAGALASIAGTGSAIALYGGICALASLALAIGSRHNSFPMLRPSPTRAEP